MTRRLALGVLALILVFGVTAAAYLALHHENQVYGDATMGLANCPQNEIVNCDIVNSSPWSELAGVPIAALAVPTYLLLLGLLLYSGRSPETLAYAFSIGILTVLYSVALFVISKTMVGFLCLWCMRLYAVNLSIPILAAIAARRSPGALIKTTLADLRRWPKPMRSAAVAFAALLALTVAGDRAIRSHVKAEAAKERERILREGGPTLPAVPSPPQSWNFGSIIPTVSAAAPALPTGAVPYQLGGPLRRITGGAGNLSSTLFDFQARIGAGKPVALIFWAPGFAWSERALVEMSAFLRKETPQYEVYAVSGLRDGQRDEEIQEKAGLLSLPSDLPLLVDHGFKVGTALGVNDVPNVTLFSAKGRLVIAQLKDRDQTLITETGNRPAVEVIRQVATSPDVPQIARMFPYYPSGRLLNHCAPAFSGKAFGTKAPIEFKGKSSKGRPTIVVFWSSTCQHCRIDVPQLVKWLKANPDRVDVVGVTIIQKDREGKPSHRAITDAYIKAMEITWPNVEDEGGVISDAYHVTSTPTTLFVSPSGEVEDLWYYAHQEGFDAAIEASIRKAGTTASACTNVEPGPSPRIATSVMGDDGKRVELASQLDRPGLVHFWATWCKPCVEELPSLMKFRSDVEKNGAARVVLISVEDEADGTSIREFGKKLGLDLRSYRAPKGGLADRVDLSYRLPRTFVVGPGGVVLDEKQGSVKWDDPAVTAGIRARLKR